MRDADEDSADNGADSDESGEESEESGDDADDGGDDNDENDENDGGVCCGLAAESGSTVIAGRSAAGLTTVGSGSA